MASPPLHGGWNALSTTRDHIISAMKQSVVKKTHKFGTGVPNNIDEAHALDMANSNTLRADAIAKGMKNVRWHSMFLKEMRAPSGTSRDLMPWNL
jgi:hypothetical protein